MDFDIETSSIILVSFQMKVIFGHTYALSERKTCQKNFVKSNESKISIIIEMVESTHIQYITNYFIKFCNYLNHFESIFSLCNILLHILFYHKYIFNHLILIKIVISFDNLHYLTIDLVEVESCTISKKIVCATTFFNHYSALSPISLICNV